MASTFAMSPIQHSRVKCGGMGLIDPRAIGAARRRRKETVNERVEHILRGALRDAEEDALQEREGDPETRGRALQRSHQLAALYTTSMENKFLRSRAKRDASIRRCAEAKAKRSSEKSASRAKSRAGSNYAGSIIGEVDESEESDDETCSVGRSVLVSPIKSDVREAVPRSPITSATSPLKSVRPWYGCSLTATLDEQIPPGIALDAKLRRYGARGTAKLQYGWRSHEALEPLSPSHPVVPVDEFVSGLSGSPSLWPPEAFHPSGSPLRVTMTRCPSSPIAVSVAVRSACDHDSAAEPCNMHVKSQASLQQKTSHKLQTLYVREKEIALKERAQNQQDMTEWQSRTIHFEPSSELAAHRQEKQSDQQLRHRRTQASAIVQTPGYSPEKQRRKESGKLQKKRFALRWRSFARLLDAMRRTPCRRPVLQDMEKLFALARELGAVNALGTCMLSRSQFVLLVTREFPLCDPKYINRLYSSYDWELRDSVDARMILGVIRAMRVQQGEPVELICASLRDFDGITGGSNKTVDDNKALVSDSTCLAKVLLLCCSTDDEELDMKGRAEDIWSRTLSWQRQILSRRRNGEPKYNVWNTLGLCKSVSSNVPSRMSDAASSNCNDELDQKAELEAEVNTDGVSDNSEDDEDTIDDLPYLIRLVEESRVPIRRVREALKREKETLALFTQQLLQRRRECLVAASTQSPRC
ncbi:unnamed protein product [Phytophthora lilii]|uniref:Unnamed protein product n=1 Tax=Phytophthora lilii TaxID=2077276 RepID=A0A9W6TCD4_9STRA|nr:unnamed protein product [Phytophthora lilii]